MNTAFALNESEKEKIYKLNMVNGDTEKIISIKII